MATGTEGAMWGLIRESRLPGGWHRVENRVDPGMPDLHFAWNDGKRFRTGWIELKTLALVRMERVVLIPHFRRAQRFWLRSYSVSGGFASMLLRIDSASEGFMYFLLPGKWAAEHAGVDATIQNMINHSAAYWIGTWDRDIFLQGLVRCHDHLRAY